MMFVATVYVEGGPHEDETFVCGPFATEREANAACAVLDTLGVAAPYRLYDDAHKVIDDL